LITRQERIRSLTADDPVFDNRDQFFKSRTEGYERSLEIIHRLQIYKRKFNLTEAEFDVLKFETVTQSLPTMLHDIAFVPFLKSQCSPEQHAKWVPPAEKYVYVPLNSNDELLTFKSKGNHRILQPN